MTARQKTKKNLCADCQNLVGKPRHTKPHDNLRMTGGKSASSIYTCKSCNHEWLYETGSNGMGWVV